MSAITIFCDFDGPIADVSERYYATYRQGLAWIQAAAKVQGEPLTVRYLSKSQFWTFKQNRVPDRQIAHWSGLNGSQIDAFLAQVSRIVNQAALLDHDQVQPQARAGLDILRQSGVRVVLVTLRPPDQVLEFLAQHDLAWAISDLYGMPQVEAAYNNQASHKIDLLRTAIATQTRQGYDLSQAWMIGDTEADIMAGQTLGIDTVAVTCGIRSSSYLQSFRPTHLLPDLWTTCQKIQQRAIVARQRG
ncbi:HAD family hydrolase [Nodosilinea sp. LEGE 06152]|uniref:HAD family hydrolase n=1 Tax=Nodosilinea sp. LEGE 06152 TaxID=2777966 RepID=UPI00187E3B0A|nr:HAD hydrolase-like protein [Nodosilinea sp. LEGE 06152]MBE9157527.1 HAD family hydrolase [Nodosilinea sp. LEGE 06152]